MPTTVTRTIGTSGRNHSTIKDWIDWCVTNYPNAVTSDVLLKGELYNDSEFTSSVYGGAVDSIIYAGSTIVTDATRYLWLTPAAGQGFKDHVDAATSPLRYDVSRGVGGRITGNYKHLIGAPSLGTSTTKLVIDGMQFFYDSTYSSGSYRPVESSNVQLYNCLFEERRTSDNLFASASNNEAVNCVFVSRGATYNGTLVAGPGALRNCTIVRPSDLSGGGTGVNESFSSYPTVVNTAVFGFTTAFGGTIASYGGGSTNNASDATVSNIPGGSDQGSLTYSSQFENVTDATRDWRPKAGGALNTNGVRDQTYTNDLDLIGAARSTSTPSIGAREYTSPADTTPDAFSFTDQTGVAASSTITSNTLTVAGVTAATAITTTVSGGEWQKNGGSWTTAPGTVVLGDTFAVRGTSSSGVTTDVTLTIGGVSDTFSFTTAGTPVVVMGGRLSSFP
jgi:hypothetical protein